MADLAYLSIWFRDFTIERGTHHLEALLTLFPLAETRPDLWLVVRSLDPAQGVTAEEEMVAGPEFVRERCSEFLHEDTAYEVGAFWDLWQWKPTDGPALEWTRKPSAVEFVLQGTDYDSGRAAETGHIWIHLGAEHIYAGLGGILTGTELNPESATTRAESEFAWALQEPEEMNLYRRHTRENARQLYDLVREAKASLPVERLRMWSEGEADFEAMTQQIVSSSD